MTPEGERELLLRLTRIERRLAVIGGAIAGGSVALLGGYLLGEEDASLGAFFAMIALGALAGGITWFVFREFID
jgi:membrane protein DedA with SNARE-associated domain